MNWDELLERVKDIPTTRVVVELHKPEYWENIYDPSWNRNECSVCFTDGNLEVPSYPCPTIQEIEKAME